MSRVLKESYICKTNLTLSDAREGVYNQFTPDTLFSSCLASVSKRLETGDMTVCLTNMLILV